MEIKRTIIESPFKNYKERIRILEKNYRNQRHKELEQALLSPEYWQILNKVEKHKNIAYITAKGFRDIPVEISIRKQERRGLDPKTIYTFKNGKEDVGYLELIEKPNGAHIFHVENLNQAKYGGINILSDRIAVENCLKRGIKDFEITGDAVWNSHAAHYLSGKRFKHVDYEKAKLFKQRYGESNPNKIIKNVIENTPKGEKYYTEGLKTISFYLPKNLIKKYIKMAQNQAIIH
jgi:hypothetical protein